jgi:hypothetical protein
VMSMTTPATMTVVSAQAAPSAVAQATSTRTALQPVFGPRLLTVRESNTDLSEKAVEQAALAEWMNSIQLSSLPNASPDDLRFDTTATLRPDARTYRTGRPLQGKVEFSAWTFQK